MNTILKEKWIKVQEGGKPKGPSDPKDHGRDKAHGWTFCSGCQEKKRMLIYKHKKQRLKDILKQLYFWPKLYCNIVEVTCHSYSSSMQYDYKQTGKYISF